MTLSRNTRMVSLVVATALIGACGGGGGSSAGASGPTGGSTAWVQGQFSPSSTVAAMCATPRSGVDPTTQHPYPDHPGTALEEKNWLRSWTNELYLWFDEVPDQNPANFTSDGTYFDALKTSAITASGKPKDRFHFTYATATWEALSQSGVEAGYGANFVIIASKPPRNVVVAYTEPGSPAANVSPSIARGGKVLAVDGVDLVNANDQSSIDTLNAGLTPQSVGESHTFSILDAGSATARSVTLVSAKITTTPVQNVKVLSTAAGGSVGYLQFNDHVATAEKELVAAFTQLQAAGVNDLVLDIRYNGGGYLDIASELAYMIAGPTVTAGQTFELSKFNSKNPTVDPVTGKAIVPLGFHTTTQGFSLPSGQTLPTLNLPRVFVLTGADTCSASESIINSLRGVNIVVVQVGTTTCGKPYAFYPADNCGVTYFSIQMQGVNAQGFGDYSDGFTPANTVATQGFKIPGCSVADDFAHALGDPAEGLLAAALNYQSSGACGVPPSAVGATPPLTAGAYIPPAANGKAIKSLWRENRIYRPAQQ
jgi:C-terminal processing protease CtpA/Prc